MRRSPLLAALLSCVLPGAGQFFNGESAKGVTVLCVVAAIGAGIAVALLGPEAFRSGLTVIILGVVYLFIWIPATVDAYQQAAGVAKPLLSGEKTWYVIFMLLTVGPGAIPLLWASPRFSRPAKIVLTLLVILIAVVLILTTIIVIPIFQRLADELLTAPGAEQLPPALHQALEQLR